MVIKSLIVCRTSNKKIRVKYLETYIKSSSKRNKEERNSTIHISNRISNWISYRSSNRISNISSNRISSKSNSFRSQNYLAIIKALQWMSLIKNNDF